MSRYIDAEPYGKDRIVANNEDVGVKVKDIPTANVEPVKHGEWWNNTEYCKDGLVGDGYYNDNDYMCCSVCNFNFNKLDNCVETFRFCPHCGAKMGGKAADNEST